MDNKNLKLIESDKEPLRLKEIKEEIEDLKDQISDLHIKTSRQITEYENSKESQASELMDKASQINLLELSPGTQSVASITPGPSLQLEREFSCEKQSYGYSSEEETDSEHSPCERDSGYSDKVPSSDRTPQHSVRSSKSRHGLTGSVR